MKKAADEKEEKLKKAQEAEEAAQAVAAETAAAQAVVTEAKASEESKHEVIVQAMVSRTGQEKDVCYFYLESVNWNLEQAIELLASMEAR